MSACYSVCLNYKLKEPEQARQTLQDFLKTYPHTNFNIEKFADEGVGTETVEDIMRIVLAGWNRCPYTVTGNDDGSITVTNDFNASYGWEIVLIDFFKTFAPCLADGSSFYIEPDDDYDEFVIENGTAKQLH